MISAAVMIFTYFLRSALLRLIFGSIADDVMQNALTYFAISSFSYPFIALYNSCAALFRSMGNSKISMVTSLIMNAVNIAGNAILVFIFHMGVAGVALPSLISRVLGALMLLVLLHRRKHEVYLTYRSCLLPKWAIIKRILHIGIPNALENSMFQLGRILVVSIIATFGTVQIAANAVANNLDALGCIPGQAMSLAMITVVGQCVGARELRTGQALRQTPNENDLPHHRTFKRRYLAGPPPHPFLLQPFTGDAQPCHYPCLYS